MTAKDSALVAITIGDGAETETFSEIDGIRQSRFRISTTPQITDYLGDNGWEAPLSAAGNRSVTVRGEGIFTTSSAQQLLQTAALEASLTNFRLTLPDGAVLDAAFLVTEFSRDHNRNDASGFSFSLLSSGTVTYTGV